MTQSMKDPLHPNRSSGMSTVVKVVGGIVAFFALLFIGFIFFIAVVCGK